MTQAAFTTGALSAADLDALADELAAVLPYSEQSRETFLRLVDEAIAEFRELREPAMADLLERKDRITDLAKTARAFAKAVAALDDDSHDLLEQAIWAAEGKGGEVPVEIVHGAGQAASRVSVGARHWIKHPSGPQRNRNRTAVNGFIGEVARCYLAAFGERPSPVPGGTFAKVLTPILAAADINRHVRDPHDDPADDSNRKNVISRTRLKTIIRNGVLGGAPPKPGRKRAVK